MIFFTSDTHFNHTNIIKYCNRPFKDVFEMNRAMIERWNSIVNKDDEVYHLGDIGFSMPQYYSKGKKLNEMLSLLNGKIYLIKGNHDHKSTLKEIKHKVEIIEDNYPLYVNWKINSYKNQETKLILDHYNFRKTKEREWVLYGHSHEILNPVKREYKKINVGVDAWEFYPISLTKIKEIILC